GLAERRSVRAFWVCMGVSVTGMLLVLMLALPGIELYRGLSGLDSAFTALLGVTLLSERRRTEHGQPADWLVMLALAGLAGKMIYEAATGSAIFVPSQTETPLPLVHLAGAICGLVAGCTGVQSRAAQLYWRDDYTPHTPRSHHSRGV